LLDNFVAKSAQERKDADKNAHLLKQKLRNEEEQMKEQDGKEQEE